MIYYWAQMRVGSLRHFNIANRVKNGMIILNSLVKVGYDLRDKQVVEYGTGWAPILPLFFWLCGLKHCHTYDVSRLLRKHLVVESARQLVDFCSSDQAKNWKNQEKILPERVARLRHMVSARKDATDILQQCGLHYHAPMDATRTGLPDHSIDLVFSNLVLGHVPTATVGKLIAEASRLLHPKGVTIHLIDLSDQFSGSDASISQINFLQFSKEEFAKFNTPFCYQNRLRASEIKHVFVEQKLKVINWQPTIDTNSEQHRQRLTLHPDFARFAPDDLCTTSVLATAVPNA